MIAGEGIEMIQRSARDIYEFVLDFERYKMADLKIGKVHSVVWRDGEGEVRYGGRFRGLTTPPVRQRIDVQEHRRIDVRSIPWTLAHAACRFHGVFTFEEVRTNVTRVYHREEFAFRVPLRWLVEPMLRSWLESDVEQEVARLKKLLEADTDAGGIGEPSAKR